MAGTELMDDFVIARNPDTESKLPYLVRLPLGVEGVVLKTRELWPRTAKLYCHAADGWPADAEIIERVGVRSCVRRGAAIDLVLDRGREARSMFVFAKARGRDMIFWQSARTTKQARPNVALPSARAAGQILTIAVDVHERYAWTFSHQQATTIKQPLRVGDYAVHTDDGAVAGVVERKSLADLVGTLTGGKLRYLMAALASMPRAALVVEDRYSSVFKLDRVRPALVAEGIAEAQVRFPTVPIVFAETRPLGAGMDLPVPRCRTHPQRRTPPNRHRPCSPTCACGPNHRTRTVDRQHPHLGTRGRLRRRRQRPDPTRAPHRLRTGAFHLLTSTGHPHHFAGYGRRVHRPVERPSARHLVSRGADLQRRTRHR